MFAGLEAIGAMWGRPQKKKKKKKLLASQVTQKPLTGFGTYNSQKLRTPPVLKLEKDYKLQLGTKTSVPWVTETSLAWFPVSVKSLN